jgi:hypothetical protein
LDVLSGCRLHGETKAGAGGWQDSWCAGHRSVHRVVHPAALVRILVRIVLVPILVWILFPILVRIPRAWSGKRQAGVRKGVPLVEQSLQGGRTRGRLVSAVPFDQSVGRSVGRSTGQSVDWGEAFLRSETVAWRLTEPRAPAAHPLVSLVAHRSAFPAVLHRASGHRSFAVHVVFFPRFALEGNCGPKKRKAVRVFPQAVVSSTPCSPPAWRAWFPCP